MTTRDESERRVPVGVGFALASALLFGLSTPCAKLLRALRHLGTAPTGVYFWLAPFVSAGALG